MDSEVDEEEVDENVRTARQFVKEACLRGRTDEDVMSVAMNTRWKSLLVEVRYWLEKRGKKWRKMGRSQNV